MALLRRMTLNMIKLDTSNKGSIKLKRKRAAWSTDYLEGLLKRKACSSSCLRFSLIKMLG